MCGFNDLCRGPCKYLMAAFINLVAPASDIFCRVITAFLPVSLGLPYLPAYTSTNVSMFFSSLSKIVSVATCRA